MREDVGRHNAMDKVVGRALRDGLLPLHERVLCVSGRLSFELVQKAAVAGAPVLVGVGAPTSLAIALAADRGMTLAGFARGDSVNVYSGTGAGRLMPDRFDSYLRSAAELLREGELTRAEGFERLARADARARSARRRTSPPSCTRCAASARCVRPTTRTRRRRSARRSRRCASPAPTARRSSSCCRSSRSRARTRAPTSARWQAFDEALAVAAKIGPAFSSAAYVHIGRAESLRRLGRRADAEESLRAAIAAAEHAPPEGRDRIARAARRALDALRPHGGPPVARGPRRARAARARRRAARRRRPRQAARRRARLRRRPRRARRAHRPGRRQGRGAAPRRAAADRDDAPRRRA